jgi:hypothetical protein
VLVGGVKGWMMIWLPGGWVSKQSNRKGREARLSLLPSLSYYPACFFFYFQFSRRENLEEVRDFVLYCKGRRSWLERQMEMMTRITSE